MKTEEEIFAEAYAKEKARPSVKKGDVVSVNFNSWYGIVLKIDKNASSDPNKRWAKVLPIDKSNDCKPMADHYAAWVPYAPLRQAVRGVDFGRS